MRLIPLRTPSCLIACMSLLALAGCAATASPDFDSRFGDRSRQLRAHQLIDPAAPQRNAQTIGSTDGRTLREAIERHGDTYRAPPPTTVLNIGVSGGGTR
jgi:hypothetical protein